MNNPLFDVRLKKIKYTTDPGLSIEMKDFLSDIDNVVNFSIQTDDSMYVVDVNVEKYSAMDVNVVFHELLTYLEYQGITCYTNSKNEDSIEYQVISSTGSDEGFYCKLRFRKHA